MINAFRIGDSKTYRHEVSSSDLAIFGDQQVHPVYATFALGRDAEWCCRLFVLEMKEEDEEGIGTFLHINHHSPALLGQTVEFVAEVKSLQANEIICSYEAKVGDRLIASGEQGQKILKKEKIERLFQTL